MSYSNEKALYHLDSMDLLRQGKVPYPKHIEISISDLCNNDCQFCSYRMSGHPSNQTFQETPGTDRHSRNPMRQIPTAKCLEILRSCREIGVKAIQFTGGGEPTVHPDFALVAEYALDLGLEACLITNGNLLCDERIRAVVRRMTWMRVSIDASNQESYCRQRGVGAGAWDRMLEGTKALCQEASDQHLPLVIGAGFVVTPWNYLEIYDAVALAKSLGVHSIRLGLMFNQDDQEPFTPIWEDVRRLATDATRDFDSPEFRVVDRTQERYDQFGNAGDGKITYDRCYFQHFTNFIGANLHVYRCCQWAFNRRGDIDSLHNWTLKDVYDSQDTQANMLRFDPKGCGKCQFNACNVAVDAALRDSSLIPDSDTPIPGHVNFV